MNQCNSSLIVNLSILIFEPRLREQLLLHYAFFVWLTVPFAESCCIFSSTALKKKLFFVVREGGMFTNIDSNSFF
jgi:hypothetical protein